MKKVMIIVGLLAAAFLGGYVPTYLKNRDLKSANSSLQLDIRLARLRLDVAMMLVEVEQGDYGKARTRSSKFFDGLREAEPLLQDETQKQKLAAALRERDAVTAALTSLDASVASTLRRLFVDLDAKPQS